MNNISKICPICKQELFGGIGSHLNKDRIHKDFLIEQKQVALSCCGKMTAEETKIKNNLFIDEYTIKNYWTQDFNSGIIQCPICGKKLLKIGNHFNIDLSHKRFVQNEVNIVFKYYGKLSINEIIKEHTLFFKRTFFEKCLVKKFSKEYVCKIAHKLSGLKNKGHTPWNTGYTKETHPSVASISEKTKGRTCFIKDKTFEEFYGIEKAKKLKEDIGNFRRNKTFVELYGIELAREKIDKISGENCKFWQGGLSFEPYSIDFNKKFKEAIRERDHYGCLLCNLSEEDHIRLYNKKLVIHHIDYDKKNTFPQNCCSLCNRCNLLVNNNRQHWKTFFQSLLKERYGYEYTQDQKIIIDFIGTK